MTQLNRQHKAVVLLSGGMDSCVCAALAVRDFGAASIAALHVSYGQRTEARERKAFEAVCRRLNIERRLLVENLALNLALEGGRNPSPRPPPRFGEGVGGRGWTRQGLFACPLVQTRVRSILPPAPAAAP